MAFDSLNWEASALDQDYIRSLTDFLSNSSTSTSFLGQGTANPQQLYNFNTLAGSSDGSPGSNVYSSSNGSSPEGIPVVDAPVAPLANPGDKRHAEESSTGGTKDRRASTGASAAAKLKTSTSSNTHTHPHLTGSGDDDDDEDGGKKNGKDKGKTSERRKQQNRAAQRAFRERKEKHLAELEDRVNSLEQQTTEKDQENKNLQDLLSHLQKENERLKVFETAFTFNYSDNVQNSSTMPISGQFTSGNGLDLNKPPTPPQTAADLLASFMPVTQPSYSSASPEFPLSGAQIGASPSNSINFGGMTPGVSNAFTPPLHTARSGSSLSSLSSTPSLSPSAPAPLSNDAISANFGGMFDFLNPAQFSSPSPSSSSSASVTTPPDSFVGYRDPSANEKKPKLDGLPTMDETVDFDSFFVWPEAATPAEAATLPSPMPEFSAAPPASLMSKKPTKSPLISDALRHQLDAVMSSVKNGVRPPGVKVPRMTPDQIEAFMGEHGGVCPLGMPQKDDFSVDVDDLCYEMRMKAVCTERARSALEEAMKQDSAIVASMKK